MEMRHMKLEEYFAMHDDRWRKWLLNRKMREIRERYLRGEIDEAEHDRLVKELILRVRGLRCNGEGRE